VEDSAALVMALAYSEIRHAATATKAVAVMLSQCCGAA